MKYQFLYSALSLLLVACLYEDSSLDYPTWGNITVLINNEKWGKNRYLGGHQTIRGGHHGSIPPCEAEYYDISSTLYNSNNFARENIYFKLALFEPGNTGKYKVSSYINQCDTIRAFFARFFTISEDGDVVQDVYDVLEIENNYMQIESFDPKKLEIKAGFQVTFLISRRSTEPSNLPDTLRFTNGTLHTKIIK